jgi:hypothetical protein
MGSYSRMDELDPELLGGGNIGKKTIFWNSEDPGLPHEQFSTLPLEES